MMGNNINGNGDLPQGISLNKDTSDIITSGDLSDQILAEIDAIQSAIEGDDSLIEEIETAAGESSDGGSSTVSLARDGTEVLASTDFSTDGFALSTPTVEIPELITTPTPVSQVLNIDVTAVPTFGENSATVGMTVAQFVVVNIEGRSSTVDFSEGVNDDGYYAIDGNEVVLTQAGVDAINANETINTVTLIATDTYGLQAQDSDTPTYIAQNDDPVIEVIADEINIGAVWVAYTMYYQEYIENHAGDADFLNEFSYAVGTVTVTDEEDGTVPAEFTTDRYQVSSSFSSDYLTNIPEGTDGAFFKVVDNIIYITFQGGTFLTAAYLDFQSYKTGELPVAGGGEEYLAYSLLMQLTATDSGGASATDSDIIYAEGTAHETLAATPGEDFSAYGDGITLIGSEWSEQLWAYGNYNLLTSYAVANTESGTDILEVIGDYNTLLGDMGRDWLVATGDNNTLADVGGANNEFYIIGDNNTATSGAKTDYIKVVGDNNILIGGEGNDNFYIGGNSNTLIWLEGETDFDEIWGQTLTESGNYDDAPLDLTAITLDLSDLLQLKDGDNLDDYLDFTVDNDSTVIAVDANNSFGENDTNFVGQEIVLYGVSLDGSDVEIINGLLTTGVLFIGEEMSVSDSGVITIDLPDDVI